MEAEFGDRLTVPARQVVLTNQALMRGFLAQAALTPAEVTLEVVTAAFEAVIAGVSR